MSESSNPINADEFATCILRGAWSGLKHRYADDLTRRKRASEYYVSRLRDAKALTDVRGLIAELCAEGGPIDGLQDDGLDLFWRHLERDWRRVRDIALMSSAV